MDKTDITLTSEITVRPIQQVGGDHMVVAAAKVSTSGQSALEYADAAKAEDNKGLIRYLMRMRHGTPFEHASITFFAHVPAFVWWEWVRHRVGHSFNLESGRYKALDPVFWVPRRNRPMRPAFNHKPARPQFEIAPEPVFETVRTCLFRSYQAAYREYQEMLASGIASEVARSSLPFGVYYSGWVTVNPRSLMAFLSLRTHDPGAAYPSYPQAELEEAARACEDVFASGWPITYEAFNEFGRVAP